MLLSNSALNWLKCLVLLEWYSTLLLFFLDVFWSSSSSLFFFLAVLLAYHFHFYFRTYLIGSFQYSLNAQIKWKMTFICGMEKLRMRWEIKKIANIAIDINANINLSITSCEKRAADQNIMIRLPSWQGGGRHSAFDDVQKSLPIVSNKPTIIFDADVTHLKHVDDSAPSIASVSSHFLWTMDNTFSNFMTLD